MTSIVKEIHNHQKHESISYKLDLRNRKSANFDLRLTSNCTTFEMDGRHTIVITLQLYLCASDADVVLFDEICDLLLAGLTDGSDEKPPDSADMDAEIEALAHIYAPKSQNDRDDIKYALSKLITNWWHAVTWARRDIRAFIGTEEFIADLVVPIKDEIMNDNVNNLYYNTNVLEALLQMRTPPYRITRYVTQRLPQGINLNTALQYYERLSRNHGFGKDYHILLELLSIKFARNEKRHLYFLVDAYKRDCRKQKKKPSYRDYISRQGLVISSEFSVHCQRLFLRLPYVVNAFRS